MRRRLSPLTPFTPLSLTPDTPIHSPMLTYTAKISTDRRPTTAPDCEPRLAPILSVHSPRARRIMLSLASQSLGLASPMMMSSNADAPIKLGVNGFGRIGRQVVRIAMDRPSSRRPG